MTWTAIAVLVVVFSYGALVYLLWYSLYTPKKPTKAQREELVKEAEAILRDGE